jgi:hypothetical protein
MSRRTRQLFLRPAFDVETEASCGTSVAEAREALAYWRGRLVRLPWYRRGARAEAREMVARWRRRLWQAELERWRLRGLGALLLPFVDRWGGGRGVPTRRVTGRMLLALRTTPVGRMLTVIAAAAVVTAASMVALVAIAVAQLL